MYTFGKVYIIMSENRSSHEIDMTSGKILPKLVVFAVPLALSSMLQLLFNTADVIVLGRFVGSDALAAVGSTTSLTNLLVNFFIALSVGVNVVVSSAYASGKFSDVTESVHTAIVLAVVCGVFLIGLGWFLSEPALKMMGTPEHVLPLAVTYMRIYFTAMPFILLYNFGAAVLRSIGDTKRPFTFLLIAGVINVCLNLFFVLRLHMGVAGVAIATSASNVISSLLTVLTLMREDSCLKLDLKKLCLKKKTVKKIARIGVPAGIQSILFNISNVLIQSSVNSLGADVMAANTASINLEGFYAAGINSIYNGALSFSSANHGAKKYDRLDRVMYNSFAATLMFCAVFSAIFFIFGRSLLSIYTENPAIADKGLERLNVFAFGYFIASFMDIMTAMLRGTGHGVIPTVMTIIGAVGFRLIWIFTVFAKTHSYSLLIWGYPLSWALTFAILFFCYRRTRKHDSI